MSGGLPAEVDVAVVGAGAAGIAAARRLVAARRRVLVLEARDRVGGRMHSVATKEGWPIDLGAEWLHSADDNVLVGLARRLGLRVDEREPGWGRRRRAGMSEAEQRDWEASYAAFEASVEASQAVSADCALGRLLPTNNWRELVGAIITYVTGAEPDLVSAQDTAAYADTNVNWRVPDGYGTLMASLAAGLPVALRARVTRVDRRGVRLRLETERGTVTARAAILTLPPPLLARGDAPVFDPKLPAALCEAAANLPLGANEKVVFRLAPGALRALGNDAHRMGSHIDSRTGSYLVRPYGRPFVSVFLGGSLARDLAAAGPEAAFAFAADELVRLYGGAIRNALAPVTATAWSRDELATGAYAYAVPGAADSRARLAAPIDGRLFVAGEAVAPRGYFTTAHGAYESGLAAAEAALAALS